MSLASTLKNQKPEGMARATLGGGCFWCLENDLRALEGVVWTECGYAGGRTDNPTYEDVCTGATGHAEAVDVYFDPAILPYDKLIEHFLTVSHDPTDAGGQGVDRGSQYRSAIFTHDAAQQKAAKEAVDAVNRAGRWKAPIVTQIEPAGAYWPAEAHHQHYYEAYEARTGRPHIRVLYKQKTGNHS